MRGVEAATIILMLLFAMSMANVSALTDLSFGGKSGDWIEYELQEAFGASGMQWERMEFLNVAETTVTVRVTVYSASLTEINETEVIDLKSQDDFSMVLFTARVYFILGGLGAGDSVYLGRGFGNRTITGETTMTYGGVDRRVIYANFTEQDNNYVFYWDKQTGILTEGEMTSGNAFRAVLVSGTNMWAGPEFPWWLWIIVAAVIALGVLLSKKSIVKKRALAFVA
jgi:hypothetical protein